MKTFHDITSFKTNEKTFVTIGTFDGVHFGHQEIINKLVDDAKLAGKKSGVAYLFSAPKNGATKRDYNCIDQHH